MDFNLIEKFENNDCGINFVPGNITTIQCKDYTNDNYQKLRTEYLNSILSKFLDSDETNKECLIHLLSDNIKDSFNELNTMNIDSEKYNNDINTSFSEYNSNLDLDELGNNVLLSQQRIKESNELLYIHNIKYYVIIVSLVIILIIEVILIKL